MYALIGLCLVLVGIAGLQFSYLYYVDRLYRERRKYLREVEQRNSRLAMELQAAEKRLAEQQQLLNKAYPEIAIGDEVWAEIIEER